MQSLPEVGGGCWIGAAQAGERREPLFFIFFVFETWAYEGREGAMLNLSEPACQVMLVRGCGGGLGRGDPARGQRGVWGRLRTRYAKVGK